MSTTFDSHELGVKEASEAVAKAADDAKKAITEADATSRREFTNAVAAAKQDLTNEVRRSFAGDSPELLQGLKPVLEHFGTSLDARVIASTNELLARVANSSTRPTPPRRWRSTPLNSRPGKRS